MDDTIYESNRYSKLYIIRCKHKQKSHVTTQIYCRLNSYGKSSAHYMHNFSFLLRSIDATKPFSLTKKKKTFLCVTLNSQTQ